MDYELFAIVLINENILKELISAIIAIKTGMKINMVYRGNTKIEYVLHH